MVKIQICVNLDRNKTKKIKFIVFTFISMCSFQCLIVGESVPKSHEVLTKEVDREMLFRYGILAENRTKLVKGKKSHQKANRSICFNLTSKNRTSLKYTAEDYQIYVLL